LSPDVAFLEGLTALLVLAGLQFVVAWASSHVPAARSVVASEPVALVVSGELQYARMRSNRLSESEILQAIRAAGGGDMAEVAAVVLETNGTISVIPKDKLGGASALKDVIGMSRS
jgi:uncharacterized membrane protein YcaP (DUF421 family)